MRPQISDEVRAKVAALPASPGVYLMKSGEEVFYVGKAKSLQDRLRSYVSGSDTRAFVHMLGTLLTDIEVVLTSTEKEALILEDQLIKKHQPRFNVKLTDDKRFLCIRIKQDEPYPRLELVRRFGKDKARYFGPYHSASAIRESLRLFNRHFQLRTCSDDVMRTRRRPCLQYQIRRCPAPCVFNIEEQYTQNVQNVVDFLEGRADEMLVTLRDRMQARSEAQEYELAAQLRDQIRAVERSLERQRIVSPDRINRDAIGFYREGPAIEIHVMRTREGRLNDARRFSFTEQELPDAEVLGDFAVRYYEAVDASELPHEILFPPAMEWSEPLSELLSEKAGRRVRCMVPQRGDKRRLVELATQNAEQAFADQARQAQTARTAIDKLQRALHLRRPPERIECVDISHTQGQEVVASVVRFERGLPDKKMYRHYKVRTTQGQDDFQSMYEVVSRRARRGLEETDLPDLLVIDGGKGQLQAARSALDDHGIDTVELVGLAKGRTLAPDTSGPSSQPVARSDERVFVHGQKNPVVLPRNSHELFLLTHARDEAHRFAITFHRRRRGKTIKKSVLDDVAGIGPKRRRALLQHFGSVKRIRAASEEEVAQVIGPKAAQAVKAHLGGDAPGVAMGQAAEQHERRDG